MSCSPYQCNDTRLDEILRAEGVWRHGVADADPVDERAVAQMDAWLSAGRHGGMEYMERYADVRSDPSKLLSGAKSIISCAFPYRASRRRDASLPYIALYAMGRDYHTVIRQRLTRAAMRIESEFGGATRVCVDTAPLRERYWAAKAGLGFVGLNNQLIIPGAGSYFFLGEIVTTHHFAPSRQCDTTSCGECRRCIDACPGKALDGHGAVDARRCISYLTIEHRGDIPPLSGINNKLYGCDECQTACPHNAHAPSTDIPEFEPSDELLSLTLDDALALDQERFSKLFSKSAIKRTKLSGWLRNAAEIKRYHTK